MSVSLEEVMEREVREALHNNYGFDRASIDQFWLLEGDAMLKKIANDLHRRAKSYEEILGRAAR